MGRYHKIKRDYSRSFFSHRRNTARLYFIAFMLVLILGIPVVAYWQQDTLRMVVLDAAGLAPTPTPYAAEHAMAGQDFLIQGDTEQAADSFEQAVTQQPNNVNYLYDYGSTLIELGRNDEA
ncbi:MAG: tetratricopeptide repeat protein, partial [Anaerolineae bacterium]|nr:tetratricopeptide repeat protein [Anaerolineae bacterium]